jgi:GTP-binding protein
MANKIPTVALVGRTNVGKSSLFNELVGRRLAIVANLHGVTRDRNYALVEKEDVYFTLVDTGGLVGDEDDNFSEIVREQTEFAIQEADLIIAMVDGSEGLHPEDEFVASRLRRAQVPVIWYANKCEKKISKERAAEFYSLGIDEINTVSAAHNEGLRELANHIVRVLKDNKLDQGAPSDEEDIIHIAVLGKPNVGKSTFINKIIGEDRLITSSIAGTTRDKVYLNVKRDGQDFKIADTAGLRKKGKISDRTVERYSALRSLSELAICNIALLFLDATEGLPTEQDARIAGLIHERGRPFIIVVNKWDAIEKDHKSAKKYKDELFDVFKFCRYAPVLFISALSGKRCPNVLKKAKEIYDNSIKRIPTSELNKHFERLIEKYPPPVYRGEPLKLYFVTQVSVAPPTFILFVNYPDKLNFSYERYLRNGIRKVYPFEGSHLRIIFRKRTSKKDSPREEEITV